MAHHHNHRPSTPLINSADNNTAFIIGISLNAFFVIVEVVAGTVSYTHLALPTT